MSGLSKAVADEVAKVVVVWLFWAVLIGSFAGGLIVYIAPNIWDMIVS